MSGDGMRVDAVTVGGVGVDDDRAQAPDLVEKLMSGIFCDGVSRAQREISVGGHLGLGVKLVADPPDSYRVNSLDPDGFSQDGADLANQGGIDAVHEPAVDVPGRVLDYEDYGEGDGQTEDRVGGLPSQRNPDGAGHNT